MQLKTISSIPISLQLNTIFPESYYQNNIILPESKESIFSSAKKAVKGFLIILLVTNQSGAKFSVGTKSSTS